MMYTTMNAYGQVPGVYLADRESEILAGLMAMQRRFEGRGEPGPHTAWGDKCCGGDRAMFMAAYKSLRVYEHRQSAAQRRNRNAASLVNMGSRRRGWCCHYGSSWSLLYRKSLWNGSK